jgi:hypothetical protein
VHNREYLAIAGERAEVRRITRAIAPSSARETVRA